MMKTLDLRTCATTSESGEYVFGLEHTGSHACYMIFGVLKPGQKQRLIKPGKGHEEIVLAVKGSFKISGHLKGLLSEGCAFHISGEDTVYFENTTPTDAFYVIAGGHSEHGHNH